MYRPHKLTIYNLMSHEHTEFMFKQGKAILILGENYDDASQFRNGSGKSALIEGIAIAITGASIRDVKPRELVRRGGDNLDVVLTLRSAEHSILIKRKLFVSQSKSSQCQIWVDEKEVTTCTDINGYNKFIFDTLGISKEDFFSFFLITKEMYEPFLAVGDVKKKQIINRFSGADIVDKTEPVIKKESEEKYKEILTQGQGVIKLQAKSQVLSEQIQQLKDLQSDDKIELQIETLLEGKQKKVDSLESNITQWESDVKILESEIVQFIDNEKILIDNYKEIEKKIEEFPKSDKQEKRILELQSLSESELSVKNIRLEEIKNIASSFQQEINSINETEELAKKEVGEIKNNKTILDKEIADLENKLHGAITCPKCSHEFTLRYGDFNVNVGKIELVKMQGISKDYQTEIDVYTDIFFSLESERQQVNQKIVDRREVINKSIEENDKMLLEISQEQNILRTEIQNNKQQKSQLESELSLIKGKIDNGSTQRGLKESSQKQIKQTINETRGRINDLDKEYDDQFKKLKEKDSTKIDELTLQITQLVQQEQEEKQKLDSLTTEKQGIDAWVVNFKNFKSYLANQSIKNIADYTNLFLSNMGSDISIQIEGYRTLASGQLKEEIQSVVLRNGFEEGSYGCFSGGERGRIDFACILALQELINLNSGPGKGLDLLYIDEALDSVESLGLQAIIESAQGLDKTIAIVSQQEINTQSNVVIVRKENKKSTII